MARGHRCAKMTEKNHYGGNTPNQAGLLEVDTYKESLCVVSVYNHSEICLCCDEAKKSRCQSNVTELANFPILTTTRLRLHES